ncbi:unnamed protein product [Brachionus calyciflorus]|uniref:Uncharacterized protein n=1 Tax=Brachionus calyciflorus TaxID=104777 RepID=A0A814FVA9_9BILA|nr:unnamed protein product [Brachionus calyciflorus]
MDALELHLPCGFVTTYKTLTDQADNFYCLICKNHLINKNECLNLNFNRLVIKQKQADLGFESFKDLNKKIKQMIDDPKKSVEQSFNSIKNELDLRRELLKKQIDEHYFKLLDELKNLENNVDFNKQRNIFESEISSCKIEANTELNEKIQSIDTYLKNLDEQVNKLKESVSDLTIGEKYALIVPNFEPKIEEIFGKIGLNSDRIKSEQLNLQRNSYSQVTSEFVKTISTGETPKIKFFQNNDLLVYSDPSGYILLLDENYKEVKRYFSDKVTMLSVLNERMFFYGTNRKIIIRDKDTGSFFRVFEPLEDNLTLVCFKFLKNDILAGAFSDYSIKIWKIETCEQITSFKADKPICSFEDANHGNLYFTNGLEIKELNINTCEIERVLSGHKGGVNCLLRINESLLASASNDLSIRIWSVDNGSLFKTLEGHSKEIRFLDKLENNFLVSCANDNFVRIWNPFLGICLLKFDYNISKYFPCSLSVKKQDKVAIAASSVINFFKLNFK